ncbi:MAG: hypothetical protein ACFCGT_02120 [Sandaracinaceae bacterium]
MLQRPLATLVPPPPTPVPPSAAWRGATVPASALCLAVAAAVPLPAAAQAGGSEVGDVPGADAPAERATPSPSPGGDAREVPAPPSAAEAEASGEDGEADAEGGDDTPTLDPYLVTVSVGFAHWYGGTYGAPVGTYTPALTVGLVPLEWLETQLSYSASVVTLPQPDGGDSHVGFLTLALLIRRELHVAGERLMFGGGLVGGIVHNHRGVRPAFGGAIAARYLIGLSRSVSLGPFLDVRALLYELPGSDLPIYDVEDGRLVAGHSDAQIQIGVAMAF